MNINTQFYISYSHNYCSEITGNIKEDLNEFTRYVALGSFFLLYVITSQKY
jgi:hypothetical protein